jgi:hypothetical protein
MTGFYKMEMNRFEVTRLCATWSYHTEDSGPKIPSSEDPHLQPEEECSCLPVLLIIAR